MCLMVCRVENSEANRMKGLPDVAIITCQLRQEVQLTHARKSNASFRCHLAQMQLCSTDGKQRHVVWNIHYSLSFSTCCTWALKHGLLFCVLVLYSCDRRYATAQS